MAHYVHSLSRGATCHGRPPLLRTSGGRRWQVLLYLLLYNLMGACERRTFVAAVGLMVVCVLVFFTAGYVTENAQESGWQTNDFQRNNTLSTYDTLKRASAWLVNAVGNGIKNDNGSSPVLKSKPILVLYWNGFFKPDWAWGQGARPLRSCPDLVGQCEFTSNHSRLNASDILLFHMRAKFTLPRHHLPHQKWVFAERESQCHTYVNLTALQDVFNLTMTYARSSQIPWYIGICEPLSPTAHRNYSKTFNYAAKKKHLVAWFVSNCETQSRRETYVQLLGKHIDVHKHGCGGKYNCPKRKRKVCDRRLNDDYKFYLSFENSLCRDYVTEKLWRILKINVVPIVLGSANYSEILPPHSYIDVRDFASPRHLAAYLKLLNANDALYNEYFRWKANYICYGGRLSVNGCNVCRHALAKRGQTEVVTDLVAEWGSAQNCISPKQYYRGMGKYI